jgi:hypothetical protein
MKPTIPPNIDQETLLRAAGLPSDAARFARENTDLLEHLANRPDLLEQIRKELEGSNDLEQEPESLDYRADLAATFSRTGQERADEANRADSTDAMPNPLRRRQKLHDEIQAARRQEPRVTDRFARVARKVWESKNSSVRIFLREQYDGLCQICQETFQQRDGQPYFEGVYLVSRTKARWIDREGNVLCLCANCSAKFLHGEVLAPTLLRQIENFKPLAQGGDPNPAINIVLCGQFKSIRFTERHLLDLQQLLRASSESVPDDPQVTSDSLGVTSRQAQ